MHDCDVCGARVQETRRGRCWGCYSRWVEARPVGYGAHCLSCGERRRRLLRSVELWGGWQPMCFNCAGQALMLDPVPRSAVEMKHALTRDRRGDDRRFGKTDTRVFRYERRVGQRRAGRGDEDCANIDDDMIIEIVIDFDEPAHPPMAVIVRDDHAEIDFDDMTRIRELRL